MQTDRRSRRRQDTIDEILDVSLELMGTEGVAALSLSAAARRVGMQPPSLYQYFPSKMAIYEALLRRGLEQILAAQLALERGQPRVHFFERLGVTLHIIAMAVEHVEINQVNEDQPRIELVHGL